MVSDWSSRFGNVVTKKIEVGEEARKSPDLF